MGIGDLGSPAIIIKRKFRFTLDIQHPFGTIPRSYVKVASRPKLTIEEKELNFLNSTEYYPGKGKWDALDVTYIDVVDKAGTTLQIHNWIRTVWNFHDVVNMRQSEMLGWGGLANLGMYDGCGNLLELWQLAKCFPTSVDFGDLSYAESDEATIQLQIRYSQVHYFNYCGPKLDPNTNNCMGCYF